MNVEGDLGVGRGGGFEQLVRADIEAVAELAEHTDRDVRSSCLEQVELVDRDRAPRSAILLGPPLLLTEALHVGGDRGQQPGGVVYVQTH